MALIEFKNKPNTDTPINATNLNNNFKEVHPVGSVVITSTNTNPSSDLGGTWELVDKEFKSKSVSNAGFIINSDNMSNLTSNMTVAGHSINIEIYSIRSEVSIGDGNVQFGTIDLSEIGISNLSNAMGICGWSDAGNAIIMLDISKAGIVNSVDIVGVDTIPSQTTFRFFITQALRYEEMLDSACNKFYWKRIA